MKKLTRKKLSDQKNCKLKKQFRDAKKNNFQVAHEKKTNNQPTYMAKQKKSKHVHCEAGADRTEDRRYESDAEKKWLLK